MEEVSNLMPHPGDHKPCTLSLIFNIMFLFILWEFHTYVQWLLTVFIPLFLPFTSWIPPLSPFQHNHFYWVLSNVLLLMFFSQSILSEMEWEHKNLFNYQTLPGILTWEYFTFQMNMLYSLAKPLRGYQLSSFAFVQGTTLVSFLLPLCRHRPCYYSSAFVQK